MSFEKPILFLIFNRPDTTRRVFHAIRQLQPRQLFIAADGPRQNFPEEHQKCQQTRDIVKQIDWPCTLKTLFRKDNMGCKQAVSSAIDWFFRHVEDGLILEDDCLPAKPFFSFCQELLDKYQDDKRIMMISGNNFQRETTRKGEESYYFSKYTHIWGWATWKRAWQYYDLHMRSWPQFREQWLDFVVDSVQEKHYWINIFNQVYEQKIDTWDYQWFYTCLRQSGLAIVPNTNLVSNIGFGTHSTHTKDPNSNLAQLPTTEHWAICKHPPFIIRNVRADLDEARYLLQLDWNEDSSRYAQLKKIFGKDNKKTFLKRPISWMKKKIKK